MQQGSEDIRVRVDHVISDWLLERQDLIHRYCELSDSGVLRSEELPIPPKVNSFCEVMLDYISAGHFEVFEQLEEESRTCHNGRGIGAARTLYPQIFESTRAALEFDDGCQREGTLFADGTHLRSRLSALGEQLCDRFELEDLLVKHLHGCAVSHN